MKKLMNIILHLFINHSAEMFLLFVPLFNNNKQPLRSLGNYTICAGFMFFAFFHCISTVDIVFGSSYYIFLCFFVTIIPSSILCLCTRCVLSVFFHTRSKENGIYILSVLLYRKYPMHVRKLLHYLWAF